MKNRASIISLFIFFLSLTTLFAEVKRDFYNSQELQQWDFDFDLGHSVGFDLDHGSYGMQSDFSMDIKSVITPEADQDFAFTDVYDKVYYGGVIEVKDLEISFSVGDDYLARDDQTNYIIPEISWGAIEGTLYIGPVSILLTAEDHDEGLGISALDDVEVGFSNISYSVIPVTVTASYSEQSDSGDTYDSTIYDFSPTKTYGAVEGATVTEKDYGAIQLEYYLENVFKVSLGASTEYSYTELAAGDSIVPLAVSALFDFTPLEYIDFKIYNGVLAGNEGRMVFEKNNPYTIGSVVGYRFALGPLFSLTPQLGGETSISFPTAVDPDVTIGGRAVDESKNLRSLKTPFALTAGILLDWRELGLGEETDDYLKFNTSVSDTVLDGISLVGTWGYTQHDVFQDLSIPYVGVKFSIWEYEYDPFGNYDKDQAERNGLIKNLGVAFIGNFNYSYGGLLTGIHEHFTSLQNTVDNSYIRVDRRLDYGFVLDMTYRYAFLQHKLGVIYKRFDYLEGEDTLFVNGVVDTTLSREFANRDDFRLKVGFDAVNIVKNMKFSLDWYSGDLFNDKNIGVDYNEYDFFYTNTSSGSYSVPSDANLGYISFGALYRFR